MMLDDTVQVEFDEITAATDMAIQLDHKTWLPRSQIVDGYDLDVGDSGSIEVAEWLAVDKGLV